VLRPAWTSVANCHEFELTIHSPFWVKAISDRNLYLGGDGD
jgi:hypothetical protein